MFLMNNFSIGLVDGFFFFGLDLFFLGFVEFLYDEVYVIDGLDVICVFGFLLIFGIFDLFFFFLLGLLFLFRLDKCFFGFVVLI